MEQADEVKIELTNIQNNSTVQLVEPIIVKEDNKLMSTDDSKPRPRSVTASVFSAIGDKQISKPVTSAVIKQFLNLTHPQTVSSLSSILSSTTAPSIPSTSESTEFESVRINSFDTNTSDSDIPDLESAELEIPDLEIPDLEETPELEDFSDSELEPTLVTPQLPAVIPSLNNLNKTITTEDMNKGYLFLEEGNDLDSESIEIECDVFFFFYFAFHYYYF